MYWHGMIEGTFCQEQGRAHFRVRCALPKWRGRSRALPWVADFTQRDEVGEVGCHKWVKSRGGVTPEWIEDDDDFRVVLRRPVDWNGGASASDSVLSRTTQETTQQTNQEMVKKSRDGNGGKSRDRSVTRTLEYKGENDNLLNVGVTKSRDRNLTKSRDRRDGCTTQETTQQTTQQAPWNTIREESGLKKNPMNLYSEGNLTW